MKKMEKFIWGFKNNFLWHLRWEILNEKRGLRINNLPKFVAFMDVLALFLAFKDVHSLASMKLVLISFIK